jgi:cysteinyl-tRNA synthetase
MVGPVIFDTVKRYLTYLGYKVTWVINITDVDDKLIVRARELKTTVPELAQRMTEDYFACLKALNVTGVDHFPKATEHIEGMLEVIKKLEDKGYAYEVNDGVYFDVSKDPDYGKLCNRDIEQMEAGARLEVNTKKRNPGDFALWKAAKPDEPLEVQFESPFQCGRGRPGWHIECTCMAISMLGKTLDIHGGGLDLQFPHHENELAQSESYTDKPFAHFWMHNGLLKMGTAKMAGSVGNVVNIADLLNKYSAETVRFLLLSTHYRSPIEYSEERLDEIARSLQGFYRFFERYEQLMKESFYTLPELSQDSFVHPGGTVENISPSQQPPDNNASAFLRNMDDDFNTGGAIGVLFDSLRTANATADTFEKHSTGSELQIGITRSVLRYHAQVIRTMANILGLFWQQPATKTLSGNDTLSRDVIQLLLDTRSTLRAEAKKITAKDDPVKAMLFDQATLIRKRLEELDVIVEDRPSGTTWRMK